MRKIAAVLLFTAVSPLSLPAFAQQKKIVALPPLAEKIDVSVVNVDVTVTDRKGNSVSGLTRADFEVLEDGKPQPISNFYSVEDPGRHAQSRPVEWAPQDLPEKYRRKVLVLIDNLNTTMHARNEALVRLEEFIRDHFESGRYDWSIAMMGSRAQLLLPLTSDKEKLHDTIAAIRRAPSVKEMTAPIQRAEMGVLGEGTSNSVRPDDQEGVSLHHKAVDLIIGDIMFEEDSRLAEQKMMAGNSTAALAEVARAFATTEGKKIILLVTGNLPLGSTNPFRVPRIQLGDHLADNQSRQAQLISMRDQLVREANASNTSFYIIGAEGLEVPDQTPGGDFSPAGGNAQDTSAMYWLARETGGAFMPGNSLTKSFDEFDRRSSTFYSLGFTPQHPADDRYHKITVQVKGRSGLQLQYRDGYSAVSDNVQIERALRTAIGVTLQPSTLPVSLISQKPVSREKIIIVPLLAAMKMDDLQYITDADGSRTRLDVWVSVFDRSGRNLKHTKFVAEVGVGSGESATGPMTVTIPGVALKKGSYRVVVAVRDQLTDHVGIAAQKIDL
jgi:VWFA-related protein